MTESQTISRTKIVNQLLKIGHGDLLQTYTQVGLAAVKVEAELFAHLIAWNEKKGQVRDSKTAFPVLALRGAYDNELTENALAHLCGLNPRMLLKAIEYNKDLIKASHPVTSGVGKQLKQAINSYIRVREADQNWWDRTVLQHRQSVKAIYALFHLKPNQRAQAVLFDETRPRGSVFEKVAQLKNMSPQEAAGTILNHRIPFLVAVGAVGGIKNKPDIVLALIEQTSGAELINNTNMFQKLGVFDNPALKAAYDNGLERAKADKKMASLKAQKAAQAVGDKKTAAKLHAVQEDKLTQLGGIEGSWLVIGDCSGSMQQSVEAAKRIAGLLAQQVKGDVHLIFVNVEPTVFDVTGLTLEQIMEKTRRIRAYGGTCLGCGLEYLRFRNEIVNGIVIVSDGGENRRPLFTDAYKAYVQTTGIEPTVYHLWLPGESDVLSLYAERDGVPIQKLDISQMDYYSYPNLIHSLRSTRYSLVDEIMETPLLRLSDVLKRKE